MQHYKLNDDINSSFKLSESDEEEQEKVYSEMKEQSKQLRRIRRVGVGRLTIKRDKKTLISNIKPRGYTYWKNIVRQNHVPIKDQWKATEREIMIMRLQREVKKSFNLVKLSELVSS